MPPRDLIPLKMPAAQVGTASGAAPAGEPPAPALGS